MNTNTFEMYSNTNTLHFSQKYSNMNTLKMYSNTYEYVVTELPIRQNFKFCWQNLKFCQYFWSELPIGSSVDRTSNPISSLRAISHSSSFQFSYCFSFVFLTTYYCWSLTFKFILEELYTMTQWLL